MKHLKVFENIKFDSLLKDIRNKPHTNIVSNLDLKLLEEYKLYKDGPITYYLYDGEIIALLESRSYPGSFNIYIIGDTEEEFVEKIKNKILFYEEKIIELEDAIQKVHHGGHE